MTVRLWISVLVLLLLPLKHDPALELASAEKLFSKTAGEEGIKQSFLKFFANDCVVFTPHPVNGKELYNRRAESAANLSWHPVFVEVAASGDFGISTGPWEYSKSKDVQPIAYGEFFSVWKKQKDGAWKVILDDGIDYPKEELKPEKENFHMLLSTVKQTFNPDSSRAGLLHAEKLFIENIRANGSTAAYQKFLSKNVRMYRNNKFPAVGKDSAFALLNADPPPFNFTPLDTRVSASGDLGFTYGYAISVQNDSSSYVRVWRKEKDWKIAIDILKSFKH
jgi:ketosteroid isomerase-like protein